MRLLPPSELKGERIGVPEYKITAATRIRVFLRDEYGVETQEMPSGCRSSREGQRSLPYDKEALIEGKIVAVATAMIPPSLSVKGGIIFYKVIGLN